MNIIKRIFRLFAVAVIVLLLKSQVSAAPSWSYSFDRASGTIKITVKAGLHEWVTSAECLFEAKLGGGSAKQLRFALKTPIENSVTQTVSDQDLKDASSVKGITMEWHS